ncbi:MAG TPA: coniferyl aldehyde dehydrogenase [Polyangiaceae bacterium]|nr:coniferyl aldehyde dehydrogenase [Polyangiaceae bacterium]
MTTSAETPRTTESKTSVEEPRDGGRPEKNGAAADTGSSAPAPAEKETKTTEQPDMHAVLKTMRAAHRAAPAPSYEQRIEWLDKLEDALLAHKDDIVRAITKDFGNRSRHESLVSEVFVVIGAIKHARDNLREWMEPEGREVTWAFLPATAELQIQPLGVVGIISPWNYPVQLAFSPLVGALAAGNRVIIKPSELTPHTAELIDTIVREIFSPDQVVVITGGPEVGEAFSRLPFDHLVFTGSTRIGKVVMRNASENLTPVTLELGGKSPTIVGDDFAIEEAALRIMAGKCFNAGQTCIAPDYVFVPTKKVEAFVAACKKAVTRLYPNLRTNEDYTTVVNERHFDRLRGYLDDARDKGARIVELSDGEPDRGSRKMGPILVVQPSEETVVMQEEIFGPILPIVTYEKLDEAIEYVNDHPRPLALYYFGHDQASIDHVLEKTISGGVCINETMLHVAQDDLPFGGVGPSGMGHYHAHEGFLSFSKQKPVFYQSRLNARALLLPPYGKAANMFFRVTLGK